MSSCIRVSGLAHHHARKNAGPQPFEELFIAADVAAVQKRNIEFDVAAVKFAAFGEGPGGGADAQVQIPERLAQRSDDLAAEIFFAAFLLIQKQEIDIRIGKQSRAGRIRPWRRCKILRSGRPTR